MMVGHVRGLGIAELIRGNSRLLSGFEALRSDSSEGDEDQSFDRSSNLRYFKQRDEGIFRFVFARMMPQARASLPNL